ncbi:MAG: hypothetical protein JJ855_09085 [Rhodospirillales bacterium]|nr:hypothetical protein [Rhodospirillales bacterium]
MGNDSYILGLNHGEINSSAALLKNGELIAGSPEERFNRQKRTKAFPEKSIRFCLEHAGIDFDGVEAIAQAWNPGAHWQKFNPVISSQRIRREDYFYTLPDNLLRLNGRPIGDWVKMEFDDGFGLKPLYYVHHHRTHASNAFYLSPFEEAAILTSDWRGEFECTTWSHGRGTSLEVLQNQHIPNSLGMFYGTFTELLGYQPDSDEWKVMALSAFDVDCSDIEAKIRETFRLGENGTLELDQSYYKGALLDQPNLYTDKLRALLGGRVGEPGEVAGDWHCVVASAMQNIAEDIAVHFLDHLHTLTKCKAVALSGGFFMNSVFNGKVLDKTPFEELYVSYAPADVGNSMGAALYAAHNILGQERCFRHNPSSIGPSYSDDEIESALKRRGIRYERHDDIVATLAGRLNDGGIVALFQGPMEFGERALGNRSIIADPRRDDAKDRINASIKYREAYRPFAPAILHDKVATFFDVPEGFEAPYMEKVVPVRSQYRDALPAITHVDGSGRVQTVKPDQNPFFHRLISAFGEQSGFPVLLNTSFNVNGEPIVQSPDDAISTFFNSGLDCLAIGSFLVTK